MTTSLEGGVFGTLYDIAYTYAQDDTSTILDRQDAGTLAGIYLQDRITLGGKLITITPGIRLSNYSLTQENYFEPRARINVSPTSRLSFNFSYGKYYQFANRVLREDILSGSRDFWIGEQEIPVSEGYRIGLENRITPHRLN